MQGIDKQCMARRVFKTFLRAEANEKAGAE